MYSNQQTTQAAFDSFKEKQTTYNTEEVVTLGKVLDELDSYHPSNHLVNQWVKQYGHEECVPEQLHRDMRIVDCLHKKYKMDFSRATDLWCEWEDHEFELINA